MSKEIGEVTEDRVESIADKLAIIATTTALSLATLASTMNILPETIVEAVEKGLGSEREEIIDGAAEGAELAAHGVSELVSGVVAKLQGEADIALSKIGVGLSRMTLDALNLTTEFGAALLMAGASSALGIVGSALNFAMAGISQYEMMKTDKEIVDVEEEMSMIDERLAMSISEYDLKIVHLEEDIQVKQKEVHSKQAEIVAYKKGYSSIFQEDIDIDEQIELAKDELFEEEKRVSVSDDALQHARSTLDLCEREHIAVPNKFKPLEQLREKVKALKAEKELKILEKDIAKLQTRKERMSVFAKTPIDELKKARAEKSDKLTLLKAKKSDQRNSRNFWMGLGMATATIAVVGVVGIASVGTMGILPAVAASVFAGFAVRKYMMGGKHSELAKTKKDLALYNKIFVTPDSFSKTGIDQEKQEQLKEHVHDLFAKEPAKAHDVLTALDNLLTDPADVQRQTELKSAIKDEKIASLVLPDDEEGETESNSDEEEIHASHHI